MKKIVIIGGGISGLSAAYYLEQHRSCGVDYHLIESSGRLGGKICSTRENGFLIEAGPDSFLSRKSLILDLCERLGLAKSIVKSDPARPVYVLNHGRLVALPEGLTLMAPTRVLPFLHSPLISWPGKLRMGLEFVIPARGGEDESLASFVRRRLGAEALEKIADPLMAGIYAADPDKLSMKSAFPLFLKMERTHGSFLRALRKEKKLNSKSKPRTGHAAFVTFREGTQQLVDAIEERLPAGAILRGQKIITVARESDQYEIVLPGGRRMRADAVIFATPAFVTAALVEQIDSGLAARLRAIRYVSTATVSLGFRRQDVPHALRGSGFVVPRREKRLITACSWSSAKFPERAPEGFVLMRVFLGGSRAPDIALLSDSALLDIASRELRDIMGISASPVLEKTYRWERANPQYDVGHSSRIAEIEQIAAAHHGLYLAGAAYHGPGIPDCVETGIRAATRSLADLASGTGHLEATADRLVERASR